MCGGQFSGGDDNHRLVLLPTTALGVAAKSLREGRQTALKVLESFHTCPIPNSPDSVEHCEAGAHSCWPTSPPAEPNGGTEAMNGIIELHRRIARGFRNPATTDSA